MESGKELLYSSGATSFGRPTYEHLEAMAKVYNEVRLERTALLFFFFLEV